MFIIITESGLPLRYEGHVCRFATPADAKAFALPTDRIERWGKWCNG